MSESAPIASIPQQTTGNSYSEGLGTTLISDESTIELRMSARGGTRLALEALLERGLPPLTRWAHGRLPVYARDNCDTSALAQEPPIHTPRRLDKSEPRHVGAMQA